MAYGNLLADVVQSSTSGPSTFNNTSGTETGRLCRAWVYYNAATATIVSSFNISSVTVVTAGEFLFNFTNALPDGNYVIVGNADKQDGNGYAFFPNNKSASPYYVVPSTTSFGGITSLTYNSSLRANCEYTYAAVFR
jgi:hypothetical protein